MASAAEAMVPENTARPYSIHSRRMLIPMEQDPMHSLSSMLNRNENWPLFHITLVESSF